MIRSHIRPLFSMAVMLLVWTTPAVADPITAIYEVHVTGQMTAESNPEFLPFEKHFTLRMTFDPALASEHSYGPVRFSPVPLPSIAAPVGLSLTMDAFTLHGQFPENEFDALNLFATATVTESNFTDREWHYFRLTRLITNVSTTNPPPPFTAETFPAHLVLGSFNFNYGTTLFQMSPTLRLVGSLDYVGSARLIDVQPVPEPATMALVLTGGVGLLLTRSRRRRSPEGQISMQ